MLMPNPRVWAGAFLTWFVPLLVSFGLYNPQTETYLPSFIGFKIIMLLLLAAMTFFTYRWIARTEALRLAVPTSYLAANSVLDLIVLVALFGMAFGTWLLTVLPGYLVVFYALYVVVRRPS